MSSFFSPIEFIFVSLSPRAQAKMAQYLIEILGDTLVTQPLKTHPCDDNCPLPSPNDLKRRILIKNKKLHQTETSKVIQSNGQTSVRKTDSIATVTSETSAPGCLTSTSPSQSSIDPNRRKQAVINEIRENLQMVEFDPQLAGDNHRNGILIETDDHSSDDEDLCTTPVNECEVLTADALTSSTSNADFVGNSDALAESRATKAMSDLVHYIVPVRFVTFARAEERKRSYEISSFSEDKAQNLIRDHAREFVAYNQRQLSRIYPRGTRIDSSNYNPYSFWPVGCQMVALNYQTLGLFLSIINDFLSFMIIFRYVDASEFRFIFFQWDKWLH